MGNCCATRKSSRDTFVATRRKSGRSEKCRATSLDVQPQEPEQPLPTPPHASHHNSADAEEHEEKWVLIPLPSFNMNDDKGDAGTKAACGATKEAPDPPAEPDRGPSNQRQGDSRADMEEADIYSIPEEIENKEAKELSPHSPSPEIYRDPSQPAEIVGPVKEVSLVLNNRHDSNNSSIWSTPGDAQEDESSEKETAPGFPSSVVLTVPPPSLPIQRGDSDSDSSEEGKDGGRAVNREAGKPRGECETLVSHIVVPPTVVATETHRATDEEPPHPSAGQPPDDEGATGKTDTVFDANENQGNGLTNDAARGEQPEAVQPDMVVMNKSCGDDSRNDADGDDCSSGGNTLANIIRQSVEKEKQQAAAKSTEQFGADGALKLHENVVEYDVVFTDDNGVEDEDTGDNHLWDGHATASGADAPNTTEQKGRLGKVATWSDDESDKYEGGVDAKGKQNTANGLVPKGRMNAVDYVNSGSSDDDSVGKGLVTVLYSSRPGRGNEEKEGKKEETTMPFYDDLAEAKRKTQLVAVGTRSFLQDHQPVFVAEEGLPLLRSRPSTIISPPPVTPKGGDANDDGSNHLLF